MAGYRNSIEQRPIYQPRFVSTKMDLSLKIDEGYSEDPESPMRLDAVGEGALPQSWSTAASIPPQIMALNETERSGTTNPSPFKIDKLLADGFIARLCLQSPADTPYLFHR